MITFRINIFVYRLVLQYASQAEKTKCINSEVYVGEAG